MLGGGRSCRGLDNNVAQEDVRHPFPAPQASGGRMPTDELDLQALDAHMRCSGVAVAGDLSANLITGGKSNRTYRLSDGTQRWALRLPPAAGLTTSAHDVAREHRICTGLARAGIPVARPVLLCEDASVLGAPFTVAEWVDGAVVRSREDLALLTDLQISPAIDHLVAMLVRLHQVRPSEVGLESFGKPDGFLVRQVALWRRQWAAVQTRDLPDLDLLGRRLAEHVPCQSGTSVVHGDYRIDNAILELPSAQIRAVLDWELSALGDPVTDVALMCAYRSPALDVILGFEAAWSSPQLPSADDLAQRYATMAGVDLPHWPFYFGLAHLKIAVIAEGIAHRALAGAAAGPSARHAAEAVPELVAAGVRALARAVT